MNFYQNRKYINIRIAKRALQRIQKKLKKKKYEQFQKFNLICFIGNSTSIPTDKDGSGSIMFMLRVLFVEAWNLFISMGGRLLTFFSKRSKYLLEFCFQFMKEHPYFPLYTATICSILILLHQATKKFTKQLKWYDTLSRIILVLIASILLTYAIKNEVFTTIHQWFQSIFIKVLMFIKSIFRIILTFLKSPIKNNLESEPSKINHKKEIGAFVLYLTFTTLFARQMLYIWKRKLVGEGPFTDLIIKFVDASPGPTENKYFKFIEVDLTDHFPKQPSN